MENTKLQALRLRASQFEAECEAALDGDCPDDVAHNATIKLIEKLQDFRMDTSTL